MKFECAISFLPIKTPKGLMKEQHNSPHRNVAGSQSLCTNCFLLLLFLRYLDFFCRSFRFTAKFRGWYRGFTYTLHLHTCETSTMINILHQSGTGYSIKRNTIMAHMCHYTFVQVLGMYSTKIIDYSLWVIMST